MSDFEFLDNPINISIEEGISPYLCCICLLIRTSDLETNFNLEKLFKKSSTDNDSNNYDIIIDIRLDLDSVAIIITSGCEHVETIVKKLFYLISLANNNKKTEIIPNCISFNHAIVHDFPQLTSITGYTISITVPGFLTKKVKQSISDNFIKLRLSNHCEQKQNKKYELSAGRNKLELLFLTHHLGLERYFVIDFLHNLFVHRSGIQVTDAQHQIRHTQSLSGVMLSGISFLCGDYRDMIFIKETIEMALAKNKKSFKNFQIKRGYLLTKLNESLRNENIKLKTLYTAKISFIEEYSICNPVIKSIDDLAIALQKIYDFSSYKFIQKYS